MSILDESRVLRLTSLLACAALWLAGPTAWGEEEDKGGAQEAQADWFNHDREAEITDEGDLGESTAASVALYPVRRIADLADMVTLQLGFGFGAHANLHLTRAVQFGLGGATISKVGLDQRHVGVVNESKSEVALLPYQREFFKRNPALGNFRTYHSSTDKPWLYQLHRDYWEVGAELTAVLVNVTAGIHPAEIPDALLGLFGVDIMKDDRSPDWKPQGKTYLTEADLKSIKRLVIVPSRVVKDKSLRMERERGIGVYYNRYPSEATLGVIGMATGLDEDEEAQRQLDDLLGKQSFDIQRELMDRAAYTLVFGDNKWEVVGGKEILETFDTQAVTKVHNYRAIDRLPNYKGLAEHYKADAVMDVRIWDWGVWRNTMDERAVIRLVCEYKLIKMPENEVIFNVKVDSDQKGKKGLTLEEFKGRDGEVIARENTEAADVVFAKLTDILNESR